MHMSQQWRQALCCSIGPCSPLMDVYFSVHALGQDPLILNLWIWTLPVRL